MIFHARRETGYEWVHRSRDVFRARLADATHE